VKLPWDNRIQRLVRSRQSVPRVLILAGLALLIFVGSQYGQMFMEQRHLAAEWQQQQQPQTSAKAKSAVDDSLIRLVIPKIDLTSFVVEGTNHHALLLGPGHLKDTAEPGEVGNAVISGHRDTFFRHIHELDKGDKIFVDRGGKRMVYEVTEKKIVEPDDIAVTNPTEDSELTLITCYPTYYIGPAPKRLVVSAKLSREEDAKLAAPDDASRTHVQAVTASSTH
jgi:LPXTG-site transpeptidase (sortase) family protein